VVGVFGLHAQYPLAKRYTWMPQVFLGFAMSWGANFGWLLVAPDELYSIPMWVLTVGNIWYGFR
jgi:4-hydroxybenzoate polyprenyltransferase